MSFKAKTILLLVFLSLAPYIITMMILGSVYRGDFENRLRTDMQSQLNITRDRLDQSLQSIANDMRFIASLDIMNDMLTGDIDRRIFSLLELKKADLQLIGNFDVANMNDRIVASSDIERIGVTLDAEPFAQVPLYSTFDQRQIGRLVLHYSLDNLARYFIQSPTLHYSLVVDGEALNSTMPADALRVEGRLQNRAEIALLLEQDRQSAFAILERLERMFLMVLLAGTLIIALIATAVANYIVHPILLLSTTARSVTKTQDYSQRVAIGRADEIGQLAPSFNLMITGMQDMLLRLREENENRIKLAEEKNRAEMLQSLSTKLSKYLSPQIYQSIFSGEKDVTLSSSRKKLTIFFSDIVNFTGTTDQMESEDLTALLNQYLREMTDIALQFGATVDKYIGDAVMIFFGDPQTKGLREDAELCVEMAMAMQTRVTELQSEWQSSGFAKPFSIRVGIHTGYCTVGNFGTENRMDYTIVGSAVNLASRIESAAEAGQVLISEDTWLLVRDKFPCLPAGTVTPKGFNQEVTLYRVAPAGSDMGTIEIDEAGLQLSLDPARLNEQARLQLRELLKKL